MLYIPELDDMICQHLDRNDLAQCTRVSKKWYSVAAPHLWRDLSWLGWYGSPTRWKAFRRMVLEDYLHDMHEEGSCSCTERAQLPILSNCGHWIRMLPSVTELLEVLQPHTFTVQGTTPTAHLLLSHLFKRCSSAVQVQSIQYDYKDSDQDETELILSITLPRTRRLYIQASLEGTYSESLKLRSILDQLSHPLESLCIDFNILGADKVDPAENEQESQTSFKELTLKYRSDILDAVEFCSWLWKHCSHVQKLEIGGVDRSAQSLAQVMCAYMPNLCEITLCGQAVTGQGFGFECYATTALLSGTRNGWKVVRVKPDARLGNSTMKVLMGHSSTLQKVYIDRNSGVLSEDLVQVLRSCTNLHTFAYTDTLIYSSWAGVLPPVGTKAFVDQDPDTRLLRPWECEGTLKVLQATLGLIPKLPLEGPAAYFNREREIESLLYDRLALLTNLEVLRLRGDSFGGGPRGCLRMSLEGGLRRLSGLKNLRELDVSGMDTRMMGIQEVQWMVRHWPKLRIIHGFSGGTANIAVAWLRRYDPSIQAS